MYAAFLIRICLIYISVDLLLPTRTISRCASSAMEQQLPISWCRIKTEQFLISVWDLTLLLVNMFFILLSNQYRIVSVRKILPCQLSIYCTNIKYQFISSQLEGNKIYNKRRCSKNQKTPWPLNNGIVIIIKLSEYEDRHTKIGAALGRITERLKGAKFTIDGVEYNVSANEGQNHVHGGFYGFDSVSPIQITHLQIQQVPLLISFSEYGNYVVYKFFSHSCYKGF